jgi:hypothetical protein
MVAWLRFEVVSRRVLSCAVASWLLLLSLSVLEGGRNTIAVNLLLLGATGIVRRRRGMRFFPLGAFLRQVVKLSLLGVIGYMLYVFVERFAALGYSDETVVSGIEQTYSVEVALWIKEMAAGPLRNLFLGFVMLLIYIGHGLDQLGALFDWLASGSLGWGRYNLDLVVITLQRAGLPLPRFDFEGLPKPGLYFTAFGEIFLDLGFKGTLLFLAGAGFFTGRAWQVLRRSGRLVSELLLSFALCWILASPLYSILPGFLGVLLAMGAFFVATGLGRWLRNP